MGAWVQWLAAPTRRGLGPGSAVGLDAHGLPAPIGRPMSASPGRKPSNCLETETSPAHRQLLALELESVVAAVAGRSSTRTEMNAGTRITRAGRPPRP